VAEVSVFRRGALGIAQQVRARRHDIPPELRNEIEHVFQVYKDFEAEKAETRGFGNRAEAEVIVDEARIRAG
jgi:inorganic pyrophosphatase